MTETWTITIVVILGYVLLWFLFKAWMFVGRRRLEKLDRLERLVKKIVMEVIDRD